jgi:hypothetical protein
VFCVNDKNDSAKQKLGPVELEELTTIYGGGGEAGCHMAVEDCTYDGNGTILVPCPCVEDYDETNPKAGTEWKGASYNVPQSGSAPPPAAQNQKFPEVTTHPNCSRPVRCNIKTIQLMKKCYLNDCVELAEGDPASSCTSYNIEYNSPWITSGEGYCADP